MGVSIAHMGVVYAHNVGGHIDRTRGHGDCARLELAHQVGGVVIRTDGKHGRHKWARCTRTSYAHQVGGRGDCAELCASGGWACLSCASWRIR